MQATFLLAFAPQPVAEPILGIFSLDAVARLRDGEATFGREEFAAVHGNWRYLFADDATRA